MFHVLIAGAYHPSDNLPPSSNNKATIERRERRKRSKNMCAVTTTNDLTNTITKKWFELAPLPKAECPCDHPAFYGECEHTVIKEEGKTPMRYNDNYASASVNTVAPKSDISVQRDYLLKRLGEAEYPKGEELYKLFNLNVCNSPKSYKDLIEAIKGGKYTIDPKAERQYNEYTEEGDEGHWFYNSFYGIIWDGPQPDRKGYNLGLTEMENQKTATRDIIMTGDAAAGLKALQDFEAWLPVGKSN